jgi:hypothetical protein
MIVDDAALEFRPPFYRAIHREMRIGTLLTLWTARIAFLLYLVAIVAWLTGNPRHARLAWISGLLVYLSHVASAFQFQHHWSHSQAFEETARRTGELLGFRSGVGLYFNYAFTVVWSMDAGWIWWSPETYRRRPQFIDVAVHAFMAFMFFNATVVFASGWPRWLGLTAVVAIIGLWWALWRAPWIDSNVRNPRRLH